MNRMFRTAALILLTLVLPLSAFAQQDSTVEWRVTLQELETRLADLSAGSTSAIQAWRTEAEDLRSALAVYSARHQEMQISIPDALPAAPGIDALRAQLDKLNAAVDEVIRQSPTSPFHLGESVSVTVAVSTPTLVSNTIKQEEVEQHSFTNIAQAMDYMPGVQTQHVSQRGEALTMVRGFTSRGQVQFYLDGVPIAIPYDGDVDFNRFLSGQVQQMQVDKGYTSPLLGPNALGGSINLVTKVPTKKAEGDVKIGAGSGGMYLTSISVGSRLQHVYFQGTYDRNNVDYIPLSGSYQVQQYKNLPHTTMTDQLNHSNTIDDKYTGRFGWTPRPGDEYVVSVTDQHGEKAGPLYQGSNTAATYRSFWTWPYWDMSGVYFHSSTQLSNQSDLKVRGFYTRYKNAIDMWSDDTYSVMNTPNAQTSRYNDHSEGVSTEYTHIFPRNVLSGSFFLKNDVHTEYGTYPAVSPYPLVNPELKDSARQTSIGLQDAITISTRLNATLGFSADNFNGLQAQSYNKAGTDLLPIKCASDPTNTSFEGCTLHGWNYNPQASLAYQVTNAGNLFVTYSDRGRFPVLKELYTFGMGSGIPSPDLLPEHSRNWNVGFSQVLPHRIFVQAELYRSDLRDAIQTVYVTDPGYPTAPMCPSNSGATLGLCRQYYNVAKELHSGVELQARATPIERLTVDTSYTYLHREINYDFSSHPEISPTATTIATLPTLPRNKVVGTATIRLPRNIMAMLSGRYENGLVVQDTTYPASSPLSQPYETSFGTMDMGATVPLYKQVSFQVNLRNVFDNNYYYTPGYPEIGRNWLANLRWQF
jgi:iron complex outermembrane recepter protein